MPDEQNGQQNYQPERYPSGRSVIAREQIGEFKDGDDKPLAEIKEAVQGSSVDVMRTKLGDHEAMLLVA